MSLQLTKQRSVLIEETRRRPVLLLYDSHCHKTLPHQFSFISMRVNFFLLILSLFSSSILSGFQFCHKCFYNLVLLRRNELRLVKKNRNQLAVRSGLRAFCFLHLQPQGDLCSINQSTPKRLILLNRFNLRPANSLSSPC